MRGKEVVYIRIQDTHLANFEEKTYVQFSGTHQNIVYEFTLVSTFGELWEIVEPTVILQGFCKAGRSFSRTKAYKRGPRNVFVFRNVPFLTLPALAFFVQIRDESFSFETFRHGYDKAYKLTVTFRSTTRNITNSATRNIERNLDRRISVWHKNLDADTNIQSYLSERL